MISTEKKNTTQLPFDILSEIFLFLPLKDLQSAAKVNNFFKESAVASLCINPQYNDDDQKYSLLRKLQENDSFNSIPLTLAKFKGSVPVKSLSYSKHGDLLCVFEHEAFGVLNANNQLATSSFGELSRIPSNSRFSCDGNKIIGIDRSQKPVVIDLDADQTRSFDLEKEPVFHFALSPDNNHLALSSIKKIKIWNMETGSLSHSINLKNQKEALKFESDDRLVFGDSTDLKIWNLAKKMLVRSQPAHEYGIYCLSLCPERCLGATGSFDGEIKVWDLNKLHFEPNSRPSQNTQFDSCKATFDIHEGEVKSVEFNPRGTLLVSVGVDKTIKIWNLVSKMLIRSISGHSSTRSNISFSPCGAKLAIPSLDNSVTIWNINPALESPLSWLRFEIPPNRPPKILNLCSSEKILELAAEKLIKNTISNAQLIHSLYREFYKTMYEPRLLQEIDSYPNNLKSKIIGPINEGLSTLMNFDAI